MDHHGRIGGQLTQGLFDKLPAPLNKDLMDFAKIVDVFDGHSVSFVSVTQAFNTMSSVQTTSRYARESRRDLSV